MPFSLEGTRSGIPRFHPLSLKRCKVVYSSPLTHPLCTPGGDGEMIRYKSAISWR
jgi:hypothetical protein